MSVGTGIFLGLLSLGLVYLYVQTREKWNWKKIAKGFGFVCAALLILVVGTIGYFLVPDWWGNRPRPVSEYASLRFGMSMDEVLYIKGLPSHVLGPTIKDFREIIDQKEIPEGKSIRNYDAWAWDSDLERLDVGFDKENGNVRRIACYSTKRYGCPGLLGMRIGISEEDVVARLGKPSTEELSGVTKKLGYGKYNLFFFLNKQSVYYLGIRSGDDGM